ncbi:MAG: PRTRC system protein B [Bryobacteraceae bacterium]
MKVNIALHDMDVLRLKEAILIYEGGGSSRTFATLHEIEQNTGKRSAPFLTPGRALQWEQLRELHDRLYTPIQADFLPPQILARTETLLCWWSRATMRPLFFRRNDQGLASLSGKLYPHPPLLFLATRSDLFVWALPCDERPEENTIVFRAPYWNVYASDARVCLGTMVRPESLSLGSCSTWEEGFFRSECTHAVGPHKLTRYRKGFLAMWKSLERKPLFPSRYLVALNTTVSQVIRQAERHDRT